MPERHRFERELTELGLRESEGTSFPPRPPHPTTPFARPTAGPASPPAPLFPPAPADPLTPDPKMETALKGAIARAEQGRSLGAGTFPVRFTIAEVTEPAGTFPSAGYLETHTDFIASEAKVSVMYAAYALRDMVRRLAAVPAVNVVNVLDVVAKQVNPWIVTASRNIHRSLVRDEHRLPSYPQVFTFRPDSPRLRVDPGFTRDFDRALEQMIVPSNNQAAATCIHGIGYGYLNGALAAGGFFDPATDQGLWVAGDFLKGKVWPYVRIVSRNDGFVAQAGTTRQMARLVALIMTDRVLDPASCQQMRGRLERAAKGVDTPWVARTTVFRAGTITHNKLGLGNLKSGRLVRSEVSVYRSPVAAGRRYVVAWQNLVGLAPIGFTDVARVIRTTITDFEK